jgi:hypothetical protein
MQFHIFGHWYRNKDSLLCKALIKWTRYSKYFHCLLFFICHFFQKKVASRMCGIKLLRLIKYWRQKTCGWRKISWKWRFVHWRNWTHPDLSIVYLNNWFGIQTEIPSRSVMTERTWTHRHFPRRRFFECREKNTLILAFLQPGNSDIFRITAQGWASSRSFGMANGKGWVDISFSFYLWKIVEH